jgi:hypothetical protein
VTDDLTDALDRAHARQAAASAYASTVSPTQVSNIADLARTYPHVDPGVTVALGTAGVDADSPMAQQTAATAAQKNAHRGLFDKIGHVVSGAAVKTVGTASRVGFTALLAPVEYLGGQARNALADVSEDPSIAGLGRGLADQSILTRLAFGGDHRDPFRQTTIGAAATAARGNNQGWLADLGVTGNSGVLGNGYFMDPNSAGVNRQEQAARSVGLIDGHAITPGRFLASATPLAPGSTPYKIVSGLADATFVIAADPVGHGLGAVGQARRAANVIDKGRLVPVQLADTGAVDGTRQTVLPERALAWLQGKDGSTVADYLAKETDFERMRRATGRKLPASLLVQLKDANDPIAVKNLLADAVNNGVVREAPDVSNAAKAAVGVDAGVFSALRRGKGPRQPPRWTQAIPTHKIDLDNPDDAVEQLDRFQRNAKLDPATISKNNEALARATTTGERFQVVEATAKAVEDALVAHGLKPADARRATTFFKDADADLRAFNVDDVGLPVNARPSSMPLGPGSVPLDGPHLATEILDRYVELPNARDIKRATSALKPLFDAPVMGTGVSGAVAAADFMTSDLFKTFALVTRPAWMVRVVGEELARIAAAGLTSLFNHPLSYIAWVVGDEGGGKYTQRLIDAGRRVPGVEARGGTDVAGAEVHRTRRRGPDGCSRGGEEPRVGGVA